MTSKILHLRLMIALTSKSRLVMAVLGLSELGILFEMVVLRSKVVVIVADPVVRAAVHKGRIRFIATCKRL